MTKKQSKEEMIIRRVKIPKTSMMDIVKGRCSREYTIGDNLKLRIKESEPQHSELLGEFSPFICIDIIEFSQKKK